MKALHWPRVGHTCSLCRRNAALDTVWTVVGCIALLLVLALANAIDGPPLVEVSEATAISQRAYEAGVQAGREEIASSVGAAYAQGRRDAEAELAAPDGPALVEGCSTPYRGRARKQPIHDRLCGSR